jgi:hypothetical protein
MHNLDLGVYQYIVPSIIFELTGDRNVWDGPNRATRLIQAYIEYKDGFAIQLFYDFHFN